jgi:ankyrin repeat protein
MCAASLGDIGVIRELLSHGALVNARDNSGCTALYYAVDADKPAAAEALIAAGADPNTARRVGPSPIVNAAESGKTECLRVLLAGGADPNGEEDPAPGEAPVGGPLFAAVLNGQEANVRLLLNSGAAPNVATGSDKATPLFYARYAGIARALVEAGARLDVRDSNGRTPLENAVRDQDWALASTLVSVGAPCDPAVLMKQLQVLSEEDLRKARAKVDSLCQDARATSPLTERDGTVNR